MGLQGAGQRQGLLGKGSIFQMVNVQSIFRVLIGIPGNGVPAAGHAGVAVGVFPNLRKGFTGMIPQGIAVQAGYAAHDVRVIKGLAVRAEYSLHEGFQNHPGGLLIGFDGEYLPGFGVGHHKGNGPQVGGDASGVGKHHILAIGRPDSAFGAQAPDNRIAQVLLRLPGGDIPRVEKSHFALRKHKQIAVHRQQHGLPIGGDAHHGHLPLVQRYLMAFLRAFRRQVFFPQAGGARREYLLIRVLQRESCQACSQKNKGSQNNQPTFHPATSFSCYNHDTRSM